MEFYLLEHLSAFNNAKTLSGAAEILHVSEPTLSRSMKRLENELNVSLFDRGKNSIKLNEVGIKFLDYANHILQETEFAIESIKSYADSIKTLIIESVAPAPMWKLANDIPSPYNSMKLVSSLDKSEKIIKDLKEGSCDIGILNNIEVNFSNKFKIKKYLKENLMITVKKDHPLSKMKEVTFKDINGYNFILFHQTGFWEDICRKKMPQSKFIIQETLENIGDLIRDSNIPSFATNLSRERYQVPNDRIMIPIKDSVVNVTFYIVSKMNI
ncbi:MAG: LysR family transcriptional regulator [Lachnospiraceae bacterium]|nr:LysR family transcriptional regulator [Lachnospiraceae bacterium]